ncbi:MAG TPA: YeeE/YedE family protein [Gammaproteobacteria bacterium]|nr:YeeE/YedE family protein [Gammaproteobacteria bacterium]
MTIPILGELGEIEALFFVIFLVSIVFGVVARKTDFCPLGGIADVIHSGNTGRLSMYFFAIATAVLGVTIFEALDIISADSTRPPYRMSQFRWPAYLVGGALFGIGMTLCRGCGMKSILNLGGGNLKTIVAILGMGGAAVLMLYVEGFFNDYFLSWVLPASPNLDDYGFKMQDLGTIIGGVIGVEVSIMRVVIGLTLALVIMSFVFKSKDFLARRDNWIGGFMIGALIVGAFYISGGPLGELANEASDFSDSPQYGMGTQSYTFIRPMGDLLYIASNPEWYILTFGLVAFLGVGTGSVLISVLTRRFKIVWFNSISEALRYAVGGVMVGIGGILGMGCTLGQGIAGTSTLSLGSFLDLFALMLGAYIGIRMQNKFMSDHEVPSAD